MGQDAKLCKKELHYYRGRRCPQCAKETTRRWVEANRDRMSAATMRWIARNRQRHNANVRKWQKANPDKVKTRNRNWREKNPDRAKQGNRKRYERFKIVSPEKIARNRALRRARMANVAIKKDPRIDAFYFVAKWLRSRGDDVHVDHIVPLARGGSHTYENLQILPAIDNMRKGAR